MQGWAPRVLVLRGQLVPDSLVIAALLEQRLRAQHEFVRLEEGVAHGFVADKILRGALGATKAATAVSDRDEASKHEKDGRRYHLHDEWGLTAGRRIGRDRLLALCVRRVSQAGFQTPAKAWGRPKRRGAS